MRSTSRGFTLIELMITVVIVAILASIAIPSYRTFVMRSERTDATSALLRIQAAQEKYFLQNNNYAQSVAGAPPGGLAMLATTTDGLYNLAIDAGAGAQYTARATATGAQLDDTKCQTFTINQTGVRTALDGSGTDQTAECWR